MLQNLAFAAAFALLVIAMLTLLGKLAGKNIHPQKQHAASGKLTLFPQVNQDFEELLACVLPLFADIPLQRDTRRQRHQEAQRLLMIAQKTLRKQEASLPPQIYDSLEGLAQLCRLQITAYGEFMQDFSAEKQQEVEQRHQVQDTNRAISAKYQDITSEMRRYQEAYARS